MLNKISETNKTRADIFTDVRPFCYWRISHKMINGCNIGLKLYAEKEKMIKNLLNADEEPPPGTKVVVEETVVNPPTEPQITELSEKERPSAENPETRRVFEIPEDAKFFVKSPEMADKSALLDEESESESALLAELEKLEPEDLEFLEKEREAAPVTETAAKPLAEPPIEQTEAERQAEKAYENAHGTIFQSEYTPPTTGETIRQSGLAWTAGVVLFASVVFMMIFGWFADLLLGSSPWGLVGGVILGGIIGFIQLFRITSQIFKK